MESTLPITEQNEIVDVKTETMKKQIVKPQAITVLQIENDNPTTEPIIVKKDSMSYTVTGGEKKRISYWPNLESAMLDVSDRLFGNKLSKRAEEGKRDFASLVKLVEEHKREMEEKFRL